MFVRAILTSAQDGKFILTGYKLLRVGSTHREVGLDKALREMAEDTGLNHLGGDESVCWIIQIDPLI